MGAKSYRVGIDIGGTFTDLILFDDRSGDFTVAKALTTPQDLSLAVEKALSEALAERGISAREIKNIIHGTTLVTNIILQRKGAKTALLTTKGFRDAIEIAREHRYDMYDIFLEMPKPLVPRYLRLEVEERILDDGSILKPLDKAQVEKLAREIKDKGIEAVALCFLHSYKSPEHERLAAQILHRVAPEIRVSLSSEVAPEIKEYERASTTICNIYVQAVVERYLKELEDKLHGSGFQGRLLVMMSSGGLCTVDTASRFPVRLVESGPAGGALVATYYGRLIGQPDLFSFDLGGTTAKLCIIEKGKPLTTPQFEVDRVYRFKKGSGLPVSMPAVEMIEIGAGGGSIARIDQLGLLKVGPESAEADPGPVCYGRGGTEPTVTDADLLLGYLDPGFFLGGKMPLDCEAARKALGEKVARPLGLDLPQAAWGIHQVVNENMANAARMHAIERGKNPRAFPLFAFGGAGPVHAFRVGEILRMPSVICPLGAGVASTLGFLAAPLAFDFVRTLYGRLEDMDWQEVTALSEEMEGEGRALLVSSGVSEGEIHLARSVDMRFIGQGHEVRVPVPPGKLVSQEVPKLLATFEALYKDLYGRLPSDVGVEALNWRLLVSAPSPPLKLKRATGVRQEAREALKGFRPAYFPEYKDYITTPVYDRYLLEPGSLFDGPAIVEERESTAVVGPRGQVAIDNYFNLIIRYRDES